MLRQHMWQPKILVIGSREHGWDLKRWKVCAYEWEVVTLGGRSVEALVNVVPVNDGPDGLEVIGAHVLVLKVVGMLPHVHPEQRRQA